MSLLPQHQIGTLDMSRQFRSSSLLELEVDWKNCFQQCLIYLFIPFRRKISFYCFIFQTQKLTIVQLKKKEKKTCYLYWHFHKGQVLLHPRLHAACFLISSFIIIFSPKNVYTLNSNKVVSHYIFKSTYIIF